MQWHWLMALAGLGLYVSALIPGMLPHEIDNVVVLLAGVIIASIALFGFDSVTVDGRRAAMMAIAGAVLLVIAICLSLQGHARAIVWLVVPAVGLGLFGLRSLLRVHQDDE